jgi:hypothetical protein
MEWDQERLGLREGRLERVWQGNRRLGMEGSRPTFLVSSSSVRQLANRPKINFLLATCHPKGLKPGSGCCFGILTDLRAKL